MYGNGKMWEKQFPLFNFHQSFIWSKLGAQKEKKMVTKHEKQNTFFSKMHIPQLI